MDNIVDNIVDNIGKKKPASRNKKHAIIPVFIPHMGCPNDCIFCNQRKITSRTEGVTPDHVRDIIDTWLTTLSEVPTVEVAFYGGSFTGIPLEQQRAYLAVAKEYKDAGRIQGIHLSTRPDYITPEILDNLQAYTVDTIELGVQSFDDEVLRLSRRGHTTRQVYEAVALIQEYGFQLGIQLMVGLPGDTLAKSIFSAEETVRLGPQLARLYPTIVLDETDLLEEYKRGNYVPLSREEAVERTKAMYRILDDAGITILRVGLKSSDLIGDGGAVNGGTYHPAFRQLVEGAIARDRIEEDLQRQLPQGFLGSLGGETDAFTGIRVKVDVFSNGKWYSNMVGNGSENKTYFATHYPGILFRFRRDDSLPDGRFRVSIKEE